MMQYSVFMFLKILVDKAASLAVLIITLEVSYTICFLHMSFNFLRTFFAVIKHQGRGKRIEDIVCRKPTEDDLYHFKESYGELENFCPDHPLNTPEYKKKLLI